MKRGCIDNCEFSVAGLKIMIDAMQAVTFVTKDKTEDIANRIAAMGGTRKVDIIKNNIVCFNMRKHTNEDICENVQVLEKALQEKKKASFYFFERMRRGQAFTVMTKCSMK